MSAQHREGERGALPFFRLAADAAAALLDDEPHQVETQARAVGFERRHVVCPVELSNRCRWLSLGMPVPVSLICQRTRLPSRVRRTSIVPRLGEYLIAFEVRLSTTCRKSCGSANTSSGSLPRRLHAAALEPRHVEQVVDELDEALRGAERVLREAGGALGHRRLLHRQLQHPLDARQRRAKLAAR